MTYFLKCTIYYANCCALCVWMGISARGGTGVPGACLPASGHHSVLDVLGLPVETHSHAGKTGRKTTTAQYSLPWKTNSTLLPKINPFCRSQTSHFQTMLWLALCSPTPLTQTYVTPMMTTSTWTWSHCCTANRKNTAYDDGWLLIPPVPYHPLSP